VDRILKPLTRDEFRDALHKGLGRAVLYVNEFGDQEVQDDILYACLHNLAYDSQIEGSRSQFLFSLIDLTNNEHFYRQHILEALTNVTNDWDEYNLITLVRGFAQRGYDPARKALYAKFEQQRVSDYWLASEQIINLDGLEGLFHVVEVLGSRLLNDPNFIEDDYMISEAYKRFGKEAVLTALFEKAKSSVNVRTYLDKVINDNNNPGDTSQPLSSLSLQEPTLDMILAQIEAGEGEFPARYMRFGYNASEADIEQLFTRLLAETKPDQLLRYLWIFRKRAVPRLDKHLFELATLGDEKFQEAAIAIIAKVQNSAIRDFALYLLEEQPHSVFQGVIELFVKNYQFGDHKLIETHLDVCDDIASIHGVGMDILSLVEAQPYQELTNCLLWVYENTPCAHCRKNVVEILIKWNLASESLLSECLWDSYDETRDLVRTILNK